MKGKNSYIEIHDSHQLNEHGHHNETSLIDRIFPLLIPLTFLVMLLWLLKKTLKSSKKIQDDALATAAANTKAIEENNQLLQEAIQIQQETNRLLRQWAAKDTQAGEGASE